MNQNESLESRLKTLREKYRAALPSRSEALRSAWQKLRAAQWDTAAASEVGALAHRLAGSGKTFGLPTLSEMALPVDMACTDLIKRGTKPSDGELLHLERAVGRLLESIDQAQFTPAQADTHQHPNRQAPVAGASVAVIDDDPDLREHIALLLRANGYDVSVYVNPEVAVVDFVRQLPDIVLLDLMFPGRSQPALDTIGEIRSVGGSHVDVVIISALTDFATRASVARAGANLFLSKLLPDTELLSALSRLTKARHADAVRCLVVEDDEPLLEQIRLWLEEAGLHVQCAESPRKAWALLNDFQPDVVLSDINLQECSGIELAAMLRQSPGFTRLPVIFMTSDASPQTRNRAMLIGSEDYLHKPLDPTLLVKSVSQRGRAGRQLRDQLEFLVKQPSTDGGLSRHFFYTELQRAMNQSTDIDSGQALVLCALDAAAVAALDGQDIDRAAVSWHFAQRLRSAGDRRWAMLGDFTAAILLDAGSQAQHRQAAEKLSLNVSADDFMAGELLVSSATHVALLHLTSTEGTAASIAMTQAEQLLALAGSTQTMAEGYLSAATDAPLPSTEQFADRLSLAFQPIVTIDGSGVSVNSVYLRMRDAQGTMLPASRFIDDIRRQGVLPSVDAWVVRTALDRLATDPDESLFLIVHISEESLRSNEFMRQLTTMLEETPMKGDQHCLVFAITEQTAITCQLAAQQLSELAQRHHFAIMLSDYGSTRESTNLIESLYPLFVRLAGEVQKRISAGDSLSLVDRALIQTASENNAAVVAGGVESAAALSALWSRGVRRFQGYFIQAPSDSPGDN